METKGNAIIDTSSEKGLSIPNEKKESEGNVEKEGLNDVQQARLKRLQAWKLKKRKQDFNSATDPVDQNESETTKKGKTEKKPTLAFALQSSKPIAKSRIEFDANFDDDTKFKRLPNQSKQFKQAEQIDASPSSAINVSTDQKIEDDPLDAFMHQLDSMTPHAAVSQDLLDVDLTISDTDEALPDEELQDESLLSMTQKRKRKKEIIRVDHSTINYMPFRKAFYTEPTELSNLSKEEVEAIRLLYDGTKVKGSNCPKPILNWSQCGLPSSVMNVIRNLNYSKPTSIQSQAIPAIMSGRDVIGVAKTGSGKTIAFLLPMLRHIKDQPPLVSLDGPIAVIMTPTRELAVQIHRECQNFLKPLNLRACCAYGGWPIKDQIAELKRGAEIVVCTPGRMIDVLVANQGRVTNLRRVTFLVIDEADRMFDMGFEPQLSNIIANIRPDCQTVLFSATFPKHIASLARKILKSPIEITIGARSVVASEIKQIVEVRQENTKLLRVLELLGQLYNEDDDARTLIFVDRQESAEALLGDLMRRGYPCNSIHGGKDQYDRDSTIEDFRNGIFPILVATSVAARGLDVKKLKLVINYDCPNHMEDYVHRVGRTGRAGNTGIAVTFVTPSQGRYAYGIVKALKLSNQEVSKDLQDMADEFSEHAKMGTHKGGSGFGGKGLEKFADQRKAIENLQRRAYGEEVQEANSADSDNDSDDESPATNHPVSTDQTKGIKSSDGMSLMVPIVKSEREEYSASLPINDFTQRARWAVTNRSNQVKVIEQTGTSITTKGIMIPPGKTPQAGEEKLYLLIEGPTQVSVQRAVDELKRLLQVGTLASIEIDRHSASTGVTNRYSVI